jgi:hypothetical protein
MALPRIVIVLFFLSFIISCKKEDIDDTDDNNSTNDSTIIIDSIVVINDSLFTIQSFDYSLDLNQDSVDDIIFILRGFTAASGYSNWNCSVLLEDWVEISVSNFVNAKCLDTINSPSNSYEPDSFIYYRSYQCDTNSAHLISVNSIIIPDLISESDLKNYNSNYIAADTVIFWDSHNSNSPVPTAGSTYSTGFIGPSFNGGKEYLMFKINNKQWALQVAKPAPWIIFKRIVAIE